MSRLVNRNLVLLLPFGENLDDGVNEYHRYWGVMDEQRDEQRAEQRESGQVWRRMSETSTLILTTQATRRRLMDCAARAEWSPL